MFNQTLDWFMSLVLQNPVSTILFGTAAFFGILYFFFAAPLTILYNRIKNHK